MFGKEFAKKILGVQSPSQNRFYYDIREMAKMNINNGCVGQYQVVSEGVLDIIMSHVRTYFQPFEYNFEGHYSLYNTVISNKLDYVIHCHNQFNTEDSYLIKVAIKRDEMKLSIDKINDELEKSFRKLLEPYWNNYEKFKFDMELLHSGRIIDETEVGTLIIQKINIPNETFLEIYGGVYI